MTSSAFCEKNPRATYHSTYPRGLLELGEKGRFEVAVTVVVCFEGLEDLVQSLK